MPRIPVIEDLTAGPIPPGSNLLVEFDPASQWYNASLTIAAGWLKADGVLGYFVAAQPPENIRSQLRRLGLDTEVVEKNRKLFIIDLYSATVVRKSNERFYFDSLKVADLSIMYTKLAKSIPSVIGGPNGPNILPISDDMSSLARFNDEKSWVEFIVTRLFPLAREITMLSIRGIIRGVHSDWAYKTLEAASEGIVDFEVEELGKGMGSFMRIRSMRNVHFDSEWHRLNVGENFEVKLEK